MPLPNTAVPAARREHARSSALNVTSNGPSAPAEIATPAGFDQDYNFIAGIERKLDNAERDVTSRGIQLHGTALSQNRAELKKGEANLREAIEKSGVIVEKAPSGMSRGLQNKSRWIKNDKGVSWTIEWIFDDSHAELGSCLDAWPISKAFATHLEFSSPLVKKPKQARNKGRKKRAPSSSLEEVRPASLPDTASAVLEDKALVEDTSSSILSTAPDAKTLIATLLPSQDQQSPNQLKRPCHSNEHNAPSSTPTSPFRYFYLHIPNPKVPSPNPTLLPIAQSTPLGKALHGRVVREFPTIYALLHSPNNLPSDKYTLERDHAAEAELALAKLMGIAGGSRAGKEIEQTELSTRNVVSNEITGNEQVAEGESGAPVAETRVDGLIPGGKEEREPLLEEPAANVSVHSLATEGDYMQ
ncbi:hypothetical protein MMC13_001115 [Lambiella insularis]|nr:hypothetical protein [Lambiella insularis]